MIRTCQARLPANVIANGLSAGSRHVKLQIMICQNFHSMKMRREPCQQSRAESMTMFGGAMLGCRNLKTYLALGLEVLPAEELKCGIHNVEQGNGQGIGENPVDLRCAMQTVYLGTVQHSASTLNSPFSIESHKPVRSEPAPFAAAARPTPMTRYECTSFVSVRIAVQPSAAKSVTLKVHLPAYAWTCHKPLALFNTSESYNR